MKKRLLLGAAVIGAASMLCGFDNTQTADDVLNKMAEAEETANGMTMDMGMNMDIDLNMSDESGSSASLKITANGDFDISAVIDPLAMSMDGKMSVSAMGEAEEITMKMYGVTEDGKFAMYLYQEDSTSGESGWTYDDTSMPDMDSLMEASKSYDASTYREFGMDFQLAPEPADVDGTECYLLTATMDMETINTMMEKVEEMSGESLSEEEDVSAVLAYLNGLQMNLSYYVDTATYLPVSLHIDMEGSDLSALNSLLGLAMGEESEGTSMELVLNDVSIDCKVVYGDVAEITVPQEALDAVAAGEAESLEDTISEDVEDVEAMETEAVLG